MINTFDILTEDKCDGNHWCDVFETVFKGYDF